MSFISFLQNEKISNLSITSSQKSILSNLDEIASVNYLNGIQNNLGDSLYQNYLDKKAWMEIAPEASIDDFEVKINYSVYDRNTHDRYDKSWLGSIRFKKKKVYEFEFKKPDKFKFVKNVPPISFDTLNESGESLLTQLIKKIKIKIRDRDGMGFYSSLKLDKKAWQNFPEEFSFDDPAQIGIRDHIDVYKHWVADHYYWEVSRVIRQRIGWSSQVLIANIPDINTAIKLARDKALELGIPLIKNSDIVQELEHTASDTYFDPTPPQEQEPEDRNFTHPLPDLQLKRTTPKIYERKRDVYVDSMSDEVQGIQNREDEVTARLEEIDWEIDNIIRASSLSKTASLEDKFIKKIKERFQWANAQDPDITLMHYKEWDDSIQSPIVFITENIINYFEYFVKYSRSDSLEKIVGGPFMDIHEAVAFGKQYAASHDAIYVISKAEEKAVAYSSLTLDKTAWKVAPTSKIQVGGKSYTILHAFKNAPNHMLRRKDIEELGFRWQYFERLRDKGYIKLIARGIYELTQKGEQLLDDLSFADTNNIYPFEKLKENIQPNQIWKDGHGLYYYISRFPVVSTEHGTSIVVRNACTGTEEGPYDSLNGNFIVLLPANIPFTLIKQNPSRRIASEKEQVIITYEGFPDDVKEFVQDHFKNLIEKYPDLDNHIKSVKIRQAERPSHYPKTTGAEYDTVLNDISVFIPVEEFLGKLRRGLVHELTHAVQLFLDGKEDGIPGMPDSLPDEYYTGDLYLYWKNPLEEHAYSVENEFKRKYKVASLLMPDLLLWDLSANQIKEGDTVSLRLYNIVLGIVTAIGTAKELLDYDTNETLQEGMKEGVIQEEDLCAAITLDEEINGYPYETAVYPVDELELYSSNIPELFLDWQQGLPPESIIGNFQIGDKIRDSITGAEGVIKDINYLDSLPASSRALTTLKNFLNKRRSKGSKEDPNPLIAMIELFDVYDKFSGQHKPSVTVYRSLKSGVVKISNLNWDMNSGLDIDAMTRWCKNEIRDNLFIGGSYDWDTAGIVAEDTVSTMSDDEIAEMYFKEWKRYRYKESSLKFSNYDDYTKGNEKLFEERYNNYGDDGGKMFWTSSVGQRKRFEALLNFTQQPKEFLQKASILDIGCGYGDFISFVEEKYDIAKLNYVGTELVSQMIPIAQQKHPNNKFELRDIVKQPYNGNSFDLVIGSGLFALNHPKWDEFVYQLVNQMFQISRKVVAVNFLSGRESDEQFKYTTPKEVYKILSKITPNVRVEKDYLPDDFTFYLYKDLDTHNLNWDLDVAQSPEDFIGGIYKLKSNDVLNFGHPIGTELYFLFTELDNTLPYLVRYICSTSLTYLLRRYKKNKNYQGAISVLNYPLEKVRDLTPKELNLNWDLGVDIKEGDEVKDSAGDKYRVIKVEEDGSLILEDIFVRSRTSDQWYHVSPEHRQEFSVQKVSNLELNWVDQTEDDLNDFLNTIINYVYENTPSILRNSALGNDEVSQKKEIRDMITMVDGYMTVNAYDLWEQNLPIDEIKIQINNEVQYWLTQSAKVM